MIQRRRRRLVPEVTLCQTNKDEDSDGGAGRTAVDEKTDDIEVYGAQFFGGAIAKDVYVEDEEEEETDQRPQPSQSLGALFSDETAKTVAICIQRGLYGESVVYSKDFRWSSPFNGPSPLNSSSSSSAGPLSFFSQLLGGDDQKDEKSALTPHDVVSSASKFFRSSLDVSVYSGHTTSTEGGVVKVELAWSCGFNWPTFWEPRISLLGRSTVECLLQPDGSLAEVLSQEDRLESSDLTSAIFDQLVPRFWDVYHVGMSLSTEALQRVALKGPLFASYKLYEEPPRLSLKASAFDKFGREGRLAQAIPDTMFSTTLKTVGASMQKHIPSSPIEVKIFPSGIEGKGNVIEWTVPVPSNFLRANFESSDSFDPHVPVGPAGGTEGDDGDDGFSLFEEKEKPRLVVSERRKIATVKFGGSPQDDEISEVRKKLYEDVIRDGYKPAVSEGGRPKFFFLQNNAKCCWTGDGFGMMVYEWRPDFMKTNEIGLELE